tara:strand:+ start:440 stop:934 length:495 start_codon:yes stop_codon:yes gene_type:complete
MWTKGKCPVLWDEGYKYFNYVRQPITGAESDTWREQGYTHETTTGKMYDSRNPMPDYVEQVAQLLNLKNCGFVFYKMDTLDIMPTHVDHYNTYCKVFNQKHEDVRRAIVFLEDWKPGHYFEVDSTALVNWKAGEFVLWHPEVPHAASNIGVDSRYTLQITGTYW